MVAFLSLVPRLLPIRSCAFRSFLFRWFGVRSLAGCRHSLSGPSARQKISTAPWPSDCDRVDSVHTDSRSSDSGVSEPVPSLSVPCVSVLWLEAEEAAQATDAPNTPCRQPTTGPEAEDEVRALLGHLVMPAHVEAAA